MKRTLLGTTILTTMLFAGAFWAGSASPVNATFQAPDGGGGGKGFRLLRLGVPADGKLGDILRKNAKISAGFEIIDRKSMPAELIRANAFDPTAWDSLGAEAVILSDESGSQIKFRLFETAKGAKPVLSKGYPAGDPLKAANRFMNDVMEHYTQEAGPFGSRIAFVRTRREPTTSKNIQTIEMNGEAPSSITSNRSLNILPSIGPGGEVLFTSYAKRNPDLWISSGGAPTRISSQPGLNLGGTMSPDGGSIAVALSKDGNSEIYSLDRSGGIKARLTNHPAIDGSPAWSSSGQLAFVSNRAGGPQIFTMSGAGGSATRVTKKGNYNQSPTWNHGKGRGQWIVYAGRDESNRYDIFKIDAKSGKTQRITQSPGRNLDPSWSPDGRFVSYAQGGDLFVCTENGDNNVQIAKGVSTPDWGPRAY